MPPIDLAELRRLHEAATKGEWKHFRDEFIKGRIDRVIAVPGQVILRDEDIHRYAWKDNPRVDADWNFIVAAHNALPALLDELEAAREEVESMRNDRDGALYFIRLNGHELQHADELLAARDRRMKALGAAEELREICDGIGFYEFDATVKAIIWQRAAELEAAAEEGESNGQKK